MTLLRTVTCLIALTWFYYGSAEAQQARMARIGFFEGASIAESQGIEPFRRGLRELGYIAGRNIILEIRAMEGKPDRIAGLIDELLRSKVDIIFHAHHGCGSICEASGTDNAHCRRRWRPGGLWPRHEPRPTRR